jgi:hypothetical protein
MEEFEGYVGIRVEDEQLINDILFSVLFVSFILFALVFHRSYHLFMKMIRDVFYVRERLSLFEDIDGNETVFRSFMIFQSLTLCSIFFFIISHTYGYLDEYQDIRRYLLVIGTIFSVFFLFYLFKQILYKLTGAIFVSPEAYKIWQIGYTASVSFWGVLLYFPVLCLAFIEVHIRIPFFMFIFSYLFWRLVIIHKMIYIFKIKGIGFIYIILYLCAQEILPLVFLYKGIIYLYNFY